jgi:hypothetical protein
MPRKTFTIGDRVAFSQAVIRRTGDKTTADARGVVVDVKPLRGLGGPLVSVDFGGTWIAHENGSSIRTVPAVNLTRILSNGAIFGD